MVKIPPKKLLPTSHKHLNKRHKLESKVTAGKRSMQTVSASHQPHHSKTVADVGLVARRKSVLVVTVHQTLAALLGRMLMGREVRDLGLHGR